MEISTELITKLLESQTLINMMVIGGLLSFIMAMFAETARVITVMIKDIKQIKKEKKENGNTSTSL